MKMPRQIHYFGDLIKEFAYRLYDDYRLWKLHRQANKIMENVEHLLVRRKNILKEIEKIKSFYKTMEELE